MGDLIDTTEMYLKTVYELEEDGVTPLRARIVDRLGHSGPTVSQTVARMERDGLLHVLGDRRLELTPEGRARAVEVMRKHRLAERLLLDVIGLGWGEIHDEACRWEHVMSDQVEASLTTLLHGPKVDPFGNPIPGTGAEFTGQSAEVASRAGDEVDVRVVRIGEPIQADLALIREFERADIRPGTPVRMVNAQGEMWLTPLDGEGGPLDVAPVELPGALRPHLFVEAIG
ncbi:iron dependent repressor, metal binding and dimerization domain protein [Schaalia naturae]|uniref:Iron dependent repressor, metal binding and dimerization domain protein n=1 Tax=Schaalia naturae TaxID=635203 RepID=A0ABW2SJ06_9ACTO